MNAAAPKTVREYSDQIDQTPDGLPSLNQIKARMPKHPGVPLTDRDRLIARAVLELIAIHKLLERLVSQGEAD